MSSWRSEADGLQNVAQRELGHFRYRVDCGDGDSWEALLPSHRLDEQAYEALGGKRPASNMMIEMAPDAFLAERALSRPAWFRIAMKLLGYSLLASIVVFIVGGVFVAIFMPQ